MQCNTCPIVPGSRVHRSACRPQGHPAQDSGLPAARNLVFPAAGAGSTSHPQEDPVHEPQISFTGNLAQPPTLRTVAGGMAVADFRVACTQRRKSPEGEWVDGETLWFGVTCWRTVAENAAASLSKGDRVVVHGRLAQHAWTGDDGAVRTSLEVDATSVGVDLSRGRATIERPVRATAAAATVWGDHSPTGTVPASGETIVPQHDLDDGDDRDQERAA